ncbi:hypothetical protein Lfu02_14890 [Longispora fulva]|uniref:Type IV secretory pathway TraG/TraD family ATPase VirD4 n=1 Tax=Longispora fulva TaxID=619741 RepID=A0A8J7GLM3_9ACTN|nr:TraM recognition domain-containing protein [Longispora fulva]MBG6140501.1 type IV secretory pathway TraG/TraD family ATPase VirD4 [Longispora fulva]GIG57117.1 hypothetical protein Lfu02_14890 [Longispora fulva]
MTPWLIMGAVGGAVGLGGLVWLAGRIAAVLSGHGWSTGPEFGKAFLADLIAGHTATLWPGVPVPLVVAVGAVLLTALITIVVVVWRQIARRLPTPGDGEAALARPRDIARLTPAGSAASARRLRPDLAAVPAKELKADDTGILLGALSRFGVPIRASWEDACLVFMGPRTGKTTSLATPIVLAAPGPVVATSNRSDLLLTTMAARGRRPDSTVWVFDPQAVAFMPRTWWWNPLQGISTVEDAERLASHFVLTVNDEKSRDIWGPGASELLSALILAAALSGKTLADVYQWLTDDTPEPVEILEARPEFGAVAAGLRGTQHLAWETKTGIYGTARIGARCLRNPAIMAWVTPPRRGNIPQFNPWKFVTSPHDTLYLLSKDSGGSAAPLVAALTDAVMRTATRHAEVQGGRLSVPIVLVLDEAGNICKIADLPAQYSHLGGRGIIPICVLQNYAQGVGVWGETGMKALWSAATIKLVGAGTDDERFGETVSRLIGDHDVTVASLSRGQRGEVTESVSLRKERKLTPAQIRELETFTSLLLATGCMAAKLKLLPWQTGPNAQQITADVAAATSDLKERAQLAFPQD